MQFFKTLSFSKKTKARLGEIKTDHGIIKTPGFVPCATKGTLKTLPPQFLAEIGTQAAFVNTYHLVTHPGTEIIKNAGGIHKYSRLNIALMSDSGGFQVFSLAQDMKTRHRVFRPPHPRGAWAIGSKQASSLSENPQRKADIRGEEEPLVVKISEDGVKFRSTYDGKLIEFTPELSMKCQSEIGADINMAFDECIPYGSDYKYSKKATERTHNWLKRCLKQTQNSKLKTQNQYLYGVIQGGVFEDLRMNSAKFVCNQDVAGVAIGGVSVGETKCEMREQVRWIADYLPKDRPVHLLGVGQFDDILDLIKYGIDTFDCVEPTRLARVGRLYQFDKVRSHFFSPPHPEESRRLAQKRNFHLDYEIDILKGIYKNNLEAVDKDCGCYVCQNFTKSYLHHLFKEKEILGYTLATYHNLWIMERFFDRIRELIKNNQI